MSWLVGSRSDGHGVRRFSGGGGSARVTVSSAACAGRAYGHDGCEARAAISAGVPVRGSSVARPKKVRIANQADRLFRPTATAWPARRRESAGLRPPTAGRSAGPVAKVKGTPVWMQAVAAAAMPTRHGGGPSRVSARVLPHARAAALGVSAVVFEVGGSAPRRAGCASGWTMPGSPRRYGGNYGSAAELVLLPACALTTPQMTACRRQAPLASAQDYRVRPSRRW